MQKNGMKNEQMIKKFLADKMKVSNFKHYIHDNKIFFIKNGEVNEIDINHWILKMQGSIDVKEFFNDFNTMIEFDLFSRPIIDRIIPYLFTKKEIQDMGDIVRYELMDNGNFVAFKDYYLGRDGRFINIGELGSHKSLIDQALDNLNNTFSYGEAIFKEVSTGSKLFRLVEPIHQGVGRSILLASSVKRELNNMYGDEYTVVTSDRGHLYAAGASLDFNRVVETLILGEKQWLENVFDIYLHKEGMYTKFGTANREMLLNK